MKTQWSGDAFDVELVNEGIECTLKDDVEPLKAYQALQIANALTEAAQALCWSPADLKEPLDAE